MELQQRILTTSLAERKRLGIEKSTQSYQEEQLAEKKIKIYGKVLTKLAIQKP